MPDRTLRVLLLADTHLGHDDRQEFFSAFERALQPAFRGEVDLVVHGGDVFFRSRVKPGLVLRAFEPLKRLAGSGVPVVVVPGNHERSAIPYPLFAAHPGVHIFDRPRSFALRIAGLDVTIAGFPNERVAIQRRFEDLVEETASRTPADVRLLCVHQTVEGATVGPVDFVFRRAPDVISGQSIPSGFAAVLSGHIHRHQVLTRDLRGRPFGAPVFYPGSTERTSHAERFEAKGYVTMQIAADGSNGGRVIQWKFHELDGIRSRGFRSRGFIASNPSRTIVKIPRGHRTEEDAPVPRAMVLCGRRLQPAESDGSGAPVRIAWPAETPISVVK